MGRAKSDTAKVRRHMPRHRRVETGTWGDARFRALSAPQPNGQTLWMYLLSGPRTTTFPGLVVARPAVLASDLGWPLEGLREALREVCGQGLADVDEQSGVVMLRKALFHGPGRAREDIRETARPESPNVILAWSKSWSEIPDGALKREYLRQLGAFCEALGEGFAKAYREGFRKALAKASIEGCVEASPHPLANQDQEQEQDPGTELDPEIAPARARDPSTPVPVPQGELEVDAVRRLTHDVWQLAAERYEKLRLAGVDTNAAPWRWRMPHGTGAAELVKRTREVIADGRADVVQARVLHEHVVELRATEAEALGSLAFMIPTRLWARDPWWKATELTMAQVIAQVAKDRAGPRSAASSSSAIGSAEATTGHGTEPRPFGRGVTDAGR